MHFSKLQVSICIMIYAFLFYAYQAISNDVMSREQAISILIEHVIALDNNKSRLMVFSPQHLLKNGDIVEPAFRSTNNNENGIFKIDTPKWFFWIDDDPSNDMFAHDSRFVFIDANHINPTINDGIIIMKVNWWPKINGEHIYRRSYERSFSKDIVYGSRPIF